MGTSLSGKGHPRENADSLGTGGVKRRRRLVLKRVAR